MRRTRELPFAFDESDFKRALAEVEKSKAKKNGEVKDIYSGEVDGNPVGIILIEEDV
jgi:hypothetical protein